MSLIIIGLVALFTLGELIAEIVMSNKQPFTNKTV